MVIVFYNPKPLVSLQKRKFENNYTHGEHHVRVKAEAKAVCLQAKNAKASQKAARCQLRGKT